MYRCVLKYTTKDELLNMVSEQGFESYPKNCSPVSTWLFFPSPENPLFLSLLPNMSSDSESEHNTGASQLDSMMTELTTKITEALGKVQTPSLTTEPVAAPIGIKWTTTTMPFGPKLSRCMCQAKTNWDLSMVIPHNHHRQTPPFADGSPTTPLSKGD